MVTAVVKDVAEGVEDNAEVQVGLPGQGGAPLSGTSQHASWCVRVVSGVPWAVSAGEPAGAEGRRLPVSVRPQHVGCRELRCRRVVLRLRVTGTREVDVLHVPAVFNKEANWLGSKVEQGRSGDSEPTGLFLGREAASSASVAQGGRQRIYGTVPAGKFVSRVRPRALWLANA